MDRIYFAETENWKHCNKIIFKCLNGTVWPIFNEKVTEKWCLWICEQWTNAVEKSTKPALEEKKRRKKKKEKVEKNAKAESKPSLSENV